MAMTDAQLQQLIHALPKGGTRRLEKLESTSASDWKTWKEHFLAVRSINDWDRERASRELRAAMSGKAALLTSDIPIEGDGQTLNQRIAAFEARFMPAAAGQVARVEFHGTSQRPDETIMIFHGRLRELFTRAYPDLTCNTSQLAIQQFALGLADTEVGRFVLDRAPANYTDALNQAQIKSATEAALQQRRKTTSGNVSIGSIDGRGAVEKGASNNIFQCWFCNEEGHLKKECPQFKRATRYYNNRQSGRFATNAGRGRGRGNNRRGGRPGGGPKINAILEDLEDMRRQEQDPYASENKSPQGN